MPKCCPKCPLFETCESRNECCPKCDFYSNGKCLLAEETSLESLEEEH